MNSSPKMAAIADRVLTSLVELDPVEATGLGLHEADGVLPDVSLDAWKARADRYRDILAQVDSIAPESLSSAERIDRESVLGSLRVRLHELEELRFPRRNPTWYTGIVTHSVFLLLVRDFAPLDERLDAVVARLERIPGFLAEAMLRLEKPPALWVDIAREDMEGAIDFFHSTFPVLADQHPRLRQRLLTANLKALRAMTAFSEYLQRDLASRAVDAFAAGRDSFEFLLRHRHRIADSLEELQALGREELERTQRAMDRLAADAGETSWQEMVARVQAHHPSSGELLKAYEEALGRAKHFVIEQGIATIPAGEEIEVIETPVFLRHMVPFAAYQPAAPFEEKQKGLFYVTPPPDDPSREARLRGHNYAFISLTTLHESFPGHHLQLSVANRTGSPLRRLADNSMYAEGWALYCEEMMYEAGFYDRKSRLLQLKDLAWRACRVLIDVGLHTGTMTFEQAVEMLVREAKLDRPSAISEVKWYSLVPTYPLSYLRGKREILRLRDRWRERGPFEARAFHDALLSSGTLPMALAEQHLFGA